MDKTEQERITDIRGRCDKATPGPWFNFGDWMIHTEQDVEHNGIPHEKVIGTVRKDDADFIAHSREDLPFLLSLLDKAMEDISRSCKTCGRYGTNPNLCPGGKCSLGGYEYWKWRGAK